MRFACEIVKIPRTNICNNEQILGLFLHLSLLLKVLHCSPLKHFCCSSSFCNLAISVCRLFLELLPREKWGQYWLILRRSKHKVSCPTSKQMLVQHHVVKKSSTATLQTEKQVYETEYACFDVQKLIKMFIKCSIFNHTYMYYYTECFYMYCYKLKKPNHNSDTKI